MDPINQNTSQHPTPTLYIQHLNISAKTYPQTGQEPCRKAYDSRPKASLKQPTINDILFFNKVSISIKDMCKIKNFENNYAYTKILFTKTNLKKKNRTIFS
jgi:hypothetical protein